LEEDRGEAEEAGKEAMRDYPSEGVADVSQISGCCDRRLQVEELSKKGEFLADGSIWEPAMRLFVFPQRYTVP
jgi:hypothetical protein